MERRFQCTACGKCCVGWLPLSIADALAHAGRFPLAVVWTPVKPASKAFQVTAKLGITVHTRKKQTLAVRIVPTSYMPPSMPCPALTSDNLCAIHAQKPARCRTMPFFPYRDEADQADLLVPRPGWACDVSAQAPAVYRDKEVIDRAAFDCERAVLVEQQPILRAYGEGLMQSVPNLIDHLTSAMMKPGGGHVVVGFASLLRHLDRKDKAALAAAQLPVLADFKARTADQPKLAEYHRNYDDWAWELERLT